MITYINHTTIKRHMKDKKSIFAIKDYSLLYMQKNAFAMHFKNFG